MVISILVTAARREMRHRGVFSQLQGHFDFINLLTVFIPEIKQCNVLPE